MKRIVLTITSILMTFYTAYSQHCEMDHNPLSSTIVSKEVNNQNGSFTYTFKIKSEDSVTVDSIIFKYSRFDSVSHNLTLPLTLGANDSIDFQVSVLYDSTNLPYYYEPIDHWVYCREDTTTLLQQKISMVYFTPYGTTEIWSRQDFSFLPRVWDIPDSIEPQRVLIHKDSIPISTRPPLDSLTEDWQWETELRMVEGLPYAIEMKALHPDTLALYQLQDSLWLDLMDSVDFDSSTSLFINLGPKFKGTISGRLISNYTNDKGVTMTDFPLAGVKVKIMDDEILGNRGNNSWANEVMAEGTTDDNGFFSISYNKRQTFEGDNLELYFEFVSNNYRFGTKVKEKGKASAYRVRRSIGNVGKDVTINVGDVRMENVQSYPYRTLAWTHMVYRFFESDYSGVYKLPKGLTIKIWAGGSKYTGEHIRLNSKAMRHETVIWHEIGHYVMDHMSNSFFYMKGNGGDHTFRSENNYELAWSEGWATGFMSFMDVYYNNIDKEFGNYAFVEGNSDVFQIEKRDRQYVYPIPVNGIRSEFHVACVLNDLYDGTRFFNNNDPILYRDISNFPNIGFLTNTGYEPNEFDDVQLSANLIFAVFAQNATSITEFYENLLNSPSLTCEQKKDIKTVFDQNNISRNNSSFTIAENNLSGDDIGISFTLDDNKGSNHFSTTFLTDIDEIFTQIPFTERRFNFIEVGS